MGAEGSENRCDMGPLFLEINHYNEFFVIKFAFKQNRILSDKWNRDQLM